MHNTVTDASCRSPNEPNTLHFVSDDELLFRTRELARHETELTIVTIQHLDEIERRGLYDKRGYPSLFEYAVRELHYSKGCAWRRTMVMKLCRSVPGIADKLRSGELNLTTASQLQNAIEKRARKAARNAARERASESVSVPPAGAVIAGAEESVSEEVQPLRAEVAGVPAGASGAVWAPGGAVATPGATGESDARQSAAGESAAAGAPAAAGESAAAGPLPSGAATTAVTASALLVAAQAGTAGVAPAAAVPAEPGAVPDETEAARAAGKTAVAAPASAAASLSPAGVDRESAPAPPASEPPPAWTLDQKVELVDLVANKSSRETEKLLAELEPEVGLPRERQRALGGGRYELRVILDQGSVDTIAKLKGWLSHVNPGLHYRATACLPAAAGGAEVRPDARAGPREAGGGGARPRRQDVRAGSPRYQRTPGDWKYGGRRGLQGRLVDMRYRSTWRWRGRARDRSCPQIGRQFGAEPGSAAGSGAGQRPGSARHHRFGAEPTGAAGTGPKRRSGLRATPPARLMPASPLPRLPPPAPGSHSPMVRRRTSERSR